MFAQFPQAHSEVVTSLTFSPHISNVLCSTSGDDSAALWDVQNGGVNVARLQGHHRGPVNHALFLPNDPNALLTAADDRTVALWDTRRTDRPVGQLTGFHDGVNKMLLLSGSPFPCCGLPVSGRGEDYLIASACDDGRVYVHALVPTLSDTTATASETATTESPASSQSPGAPVSPGSLFGAAGAHPSSPAAVQQGVGTAATTLPSVGALVDCFWASPSTVNDLALSPNNSVIVTASEDGALRSWRLLFDTTAPTEDRLLCSLDEFENPVNHIAFVPPGLMTSQDTVTPAAAGEGSEQQQRQPQERRRMGSPPSQDDDEEDAGGGGPEGDGMQRATGGSGGTMLHSTEYPDAGSEEGSQPDTETARRQREEEERQGLRRWVLAACSEFVFGVDISIASSEFGRGARSFVGHSDYVRGMEFTRQNTLLTVSDDSTAMEWDLSSGEPIRQIKLHEGFVMASAMNRSGDALATGTDRGEIRVWRLPFQTERLGAR